MVNLSGLSLDDAEINLLLKGFCFCPTPRHMKKEEILYDLKKFFRQLRLNEFFQEVEEEEEINAQSLFHLPSSWMPRKGKDAAWETYIKKTRTDVEHNLNNLRAKSYMDNLPPEERSALQNLRQHTGIRLKPVHKGSAIVMLSKEDYIKEANRQLNESVYYRKLSADPTSRYKTEVKQCVASMYRKELIDKKVKDSLVP